MKKYLTKSNIFTLLLVLFVIWRQAPLFMSNAQMEGTSLPSQMYPVVSSTAGSTEVEFPPKGSKAITIFWATWCGPCKIEMQRLQSSIQDKNISGSQIFAINPFEPTPVVKKFLAQNKYDFTFIDASDVSNKLQVAVTPTTLFIENNIITKMSSGMSLIGIWRAEWFLR